MRREYFLLFIFILACSKDLDITEFSKAVKDKYYDEIIILVNNATETDWFRTMAEISNVICFINKRIKFIDKNGIEGKPLQGQAVLYKGKNGKKFIENFRRYGLCLKPV